MISLYMHVNLCYCVFGGGPTHRLTRVLRKATANKTQRTPRSRNAATTQPTKTDGRRTGRRRGGKGWRCCCNPRPRGAVVGKLRQRPPVGLRCTAQRGHTITGLRCGVLPEKRHEVTRSRPGLVNPRLPSEVQCQRAQQYPTAPI